MKTVGELLFSRQIKTMTHPNRSRCRMLPALAQTYADSVVVKLIGHYKPITLRTKTTECSCVRFSSFLCVKPRLS